MTEPTVLVWMLVEQEGAVLLGRRKPDVPPFAGLWTLPGDAMHESESASETLARFAHEQLDAYASGDDFVDTLYASDTGVDYAVNVFRVALGGHPRFRESGSYTEMIWAPRPALTDAASYAMPLELRTVLAAAGEVAEERST